MSVPPLPANRLNRTIGQLDRLPGVLRAQALTLLLGRGVPYVGTSRIHFEDVTAERVAVSLRNRPRTRNHIGQIHAAAMALLAETATGILVGMNTPDTAVPVIKTLRVDYRKRTKGAMRAVATLTAAQQTAIRTTDKGETVVEVHVWDESGGEPITCEMVWAWVPKKR